MAGGGDRAGQLDGIIEAAEAARRGGRLSEAREAFIKAATAAECALDAEALVRAALGVGGLWVHEHRDVVGRAAVRNLWERARDVVRPGSIEEARLAVREAAEAVYEGAALDPVSEAVERLRKFGVDDASAEALSLLHHVQLGPALARTRLELAEEIIRLATRAGDTVLGLMGLCWRTVDLFLLGDHHGEQSLAELRERTESDACEALNFIADVLGSMLLARAGRLSEAEVASKLALETGLAVGDPDAPAYYGAMLAALRWWQGRTEEIVELVRATSRSPRLGYNDHVYVAAHALASATVGDLDSSEEALARLTGIGLCRLPASSTWITTQFLVIETAYLLGDQQVAAEATELIAPYAELPVMPSLAVVCFGSAQRALGLSAAIKGRLDLAVEYLDAALLGDRRLGNRPMAVLTEHTLAEVLHARQSPGDQARAQQLASRSMERGQRIGMVLPQHPSWLVPVRSRAPRRPLIRQASLEHHSNGWRIRIDDRATMVSDRVGFNYLAELIHQPDVDLDVLRLASGSCGGPLPVRDPILDAAALRSYRRRAHELRRMLANTEKSTVQAERHHQELAALNAVLRSATGLDGRVRTFPNSQERARTAVRKAILRAIALISAAEPDLGAHLRASVITGATCRYSPSSEWIVKAS